MLSDWGQQLPQDSGHRCKSESSDDACPLHASFIRGVLSPLKFPLSLPQILLDQATFGSNREALRLEEGRAGSQVGQMNGAADVMLACGVTCC